MPPDETPVKPQSSSNQPVNDGVGTVGKNARDPFLQVLVAAGFFVSRRLLAIVRFFVGFDVFVSYARADCTEYAASLIAQLPTDTAPRSDVHGAEPGKEPPFTLLLTVALSRVLVILNTPAAAKSVPVLKEVKAYRRLGGRPILPVELGCRSEDALWWAEAENVARIKETPEAIAAKTPSPAVLQRVQTMVGFWKMRHRQAFAAALFVAGILVLGTLSYVTKQSLGVAMSDLGTAKKDLQIASAATGAQQRVATDLQQKNADLAQRNTEAAQAVTDANATAKRLNALNGDLTRQNATKAASIQVSDARTNQDKGEAIAALSNATAALSLSLDAGSLSRDVVQSLLRTVQGAAAVQVYSSEETLRDAAVTANEVLGLQASGNVVTGRLGCSSRSARGSIVDDFSLLPRATTSILRTGLINLRKASAVAFSTREILLGFSDGSARRIQIPSDGNRALAAPRDWRPHGPGQAIGYIAPARNGVLTVSAAPEADVLEYAISASDAPSTGPASPLPQLPLHSPAKRFGSESAYGDVFGLIEQDNMVHLISVDASKEAGTTGTPITMRSLARPEPEFKPTALSFNPTAPLIAVAAFTSDVYLYRYSEAFGTSEPPNDTLTVVEHMEPPPFA